MLKKPDFPLDPTTVSDEISIWSYHTMTGNDDDDGIFIIGSADCSDGFRISSKYRFFFVTSSFSEGDFLKRYPGSFLEFCTTWY